jgi:hypothetical protein
MKTSLSSITIINHIAYKYRAPCQGIKEGSGDNAYNEIKCSDGRIWSCPIRFEIWILLRSNALLVVRVYRRPCVVFSYPWGFFAIRLSNTLYAWSPDQTLFLLRLKGVASETTTVPYSHPVQLLVPKVVTSGVNSVLNIVRDSDRQPTIINSLSPIPYPV